MKKIKFKNRNTGNERHSIRYDKELGLYDVFFSGFVPMYCNSFYTEEEAREFIKRQKQK